MPAQAQRRYIVIGPVYLLIALCSADRARDQVPIAWRKRIAGPALTSWLWDMRFKGKLDFTSVAFQNLFGAYHATWLFLLFLLLIVYHKRALLVMLGVFAGIMYYLCQSCVQYYPWDMPAMFFFTLACILYDTRRIWLLMVVIWLGALFKETILCCSLLILLGEYWPLRKRVLSFCVTLAITFISYKFFIRVYNLNAGILGMGNSTNVHQLVFQSFLDTNILNLFSLTPYQFIFANAGSLFIVLLLPWRNRREVIFKLMIIAFVAGEFFWGNIIEYRIWVEVLPLGWMIIADRGWLENTMGEETQAVQSKADRAMKGSYWLMVAGLLLVAVGSRITLAISPPPPVKDDPNLLNIQKLLEEAPKGNVAAEYNLGRAYEVGFVVTQDLAQASVWYQRAAEQGNGDAQNALGMLLAGYRKDYAGAAQWFSRAATNGDRDAQYNFAALYHMGLGVSQDDNVAAQWFERAAEQNHPEAQRELGLLYEAGRGVKQDQVTAYKWLKLAQLQGDTEASNDLKICTATMATRQISAAESEARDFRAKAAGGPT